MSMIPVATIEQECENNKVRRVTVYYDEGLCADPELCFRVIANRGAAQYTFTLAEIEEILGTDGQTILLDEIHKKLEEAKIVGTKLRQTHRNAKQRAQAVRALSAIKQALGVTESV